MSPPKRCWIASKKSKRSWLKLGKLTTIRASQLILSAESGSILHWYIMCSLQSCTVSKWLTMRELIRAEERLMFARHCDTSISRAKSPEPSSREAESERCPARLRPIALCKELY